MTRRQSIWNILNAVLGGLAAIITAGTGLYLALKTSTNSSPSVSASMAPAAISADSATGVIYDRTPWLGIELRQDNQPIRLRSINDTWDKFEATLASGPFEITITRHADDPNIGIMAWQDKSIFDCVPGRQIRAPRHRHRRRSVRHPDPLPRQGRLQLLRHRTNEAHRTTTNTRSSSRPSAQANSNSRYPASPARSTWPSSASPKTWTQTSRGKTSSSSRSAGRNGQVAGTPTSCIAEIGSRNR